MERFSIRKRIHSFQYAFNGIIILLREEHNSRIHLSAAVLVIIAGWYFQVESWEWVALLLCIAIVIICEIFNTSIENIANFISPKKHPAIKRIKDLAAAAVLVSSIAAVLVGSLIFLPKIL